MTNEITAVHVTHEAVDKIGGIGAVLQGFFTSQNYLKAIPRSIIIGPLFTTEGSVLDRLGDDGEVLYSSLDGFVKTGYAHAFHNIESFYNAGIIYGRRRFTDPQTGTSSSPEVILIDIRHIDPGPVNELKKRMFEQFGVRSDTNEHLWEYEQYVRLAPPAIASLKAIGAAHDASIIMAHEFMGMPTALAAMLDTSCEFKTIFYAHEVATMRRIVEEYPGHDVMFYNVMKEAHKKLLTVHDIFGDQNSYFKTALVEASKYCDSICAVGDYVVDELRFLAPEFENANINVVYNGIPAYEIGIDEKLESRNRLCHYAQNLLDYVPDYIFTHVTRLVRSKGLWRDLRVLEHMDREFQAQNKTAIMFLLSTEVCQRRSSDIYQMESSYNWPIAHREGWPDLSGGEAAIYTAIQQFNTQSRNIKIVFINQFGFEQRFCGGKMPAEITFLDIRKGSDVEFGQSIYEPFGIAQLEPLTFGGLCVFSNVCGCAGFIRDVTNGEPIRNVILTDYITFENNGHKSINDLIVIDRKFRDKIESKVSKNIAMQICSRLTKDESEMLQLLKDGYEIAKEMSWNRVVENYLMKSIDQAMDKQYYKQIFVA